MEIFEVFNEKNPDAGDYIAMGYLVFAAVFFSPAWVPFYIVGRLYAVIRDMIRR